MNKSKNNQIKKNTFLVVIPVYNEKNCIEKVIRSWINLVDKYPGSEILVLNDGSKDNTTGILNKLVKRFHKLKVIHKINEGHGATIIKGYSEAVKTNHQWTFQIDSDNQLFAKDFHKLWDHRYESNYILGYRLKRKDPFHRLLITKANAILIWMLFGSYIKDANIPYRLIKTDYLKNLLKVLPGHVFAPNIIMAVIAIKEGQDLMNIPISHSQRKTGRVSMTRWKLIQVSFEMTKELIFLRSKLSKILKNISN